MIRPSLKVAGILRMSSAPYASFSTPPRAPQFARCNHSPLFTTIRLLSATLLFALFFTAHLRAEDVLAPGKQIEKIFSDGKFTEGPAVDAQGNVFFSDGPNDRIMRLDPQG